MNFYTAIQTALREHIENTKGLSIKKYAEERLHASHTTLHKVFNGDSPMKDYIEWLFVISKDTGKPVEYFLQEFIEKYHISLVHKPGGENVVKEILPMATEAITDINCKHQLELSLQKNQFQEVIIEKNEYIIKDKEDLVCMKDKIIKLLEKHID